MGAKAFLSIGQGGLDGQETLVGIVGRIPHNGFIGAASYDAAPNLLNRSGSFLFFKKLQVWYY